MKTELNIGYTFQTKDDICTFFATIKKGSILRLNRFENGLHQCEVLNGIGNTKPDDGVIITGIIVNLTEEEITGNNDKKKEKRTYEKPISYY